MASTPPHCSITTNKPYQQHQQQQNQHQHHHHLKNHRQSHHQSRHKVSLTKPIPVPLPSPSSRNASKPCATTDPNSSFPIPSLCPQKSELSHEFSGRRSTRFVSKMHVGRPKPSSNGSQSRHTPAAEEALIQLLQLGVNDDKGLERVLLSFGSKLWSPDDYSFLFRELGNREECWKAIQCFEFAVRKERRRNEQGKLASSMISVLGRLKRIDLARDVFETARSRGYGNTVYAYSALINAYGRCGCCDEAIMVFELMKKLGFFPNLVTYNAVIDACAKGGVDYPRVEEFFNEMLRNNVQPDRITYNSLLAVCSRLGKWEKAQALFSEMVEKGVDQDIFTYNTLLDAVCKGAQMDLAHEIMSAMPILPTVVTYSTMIGGYAKQGRFEEALGLFNEMKFLNIGSDRVLYNTLVSIYANLGRFEEAMNVCKEMGNCGIEKDVVTYNALLGGYGKHGKYSVVRRLYREMKAEQIYPNLLTYSTFIDVLSKGGLYSEAMEVFREFKQAGLKADVVLYTALIDALCKHGMVDSAISLVDDMVKEGIRPNVVTYNSIIDAFGWARAAECQVVAAAEAGKRDSTSTSSMVIKDAIDLEVGDREDNRIMKMLGKLATDKVVHLKKGKIDRQEILCILGIFQKMHQLKIKPNVVTFSAILNACSRCNLFEDASMLLDELRLLGNQVYGVAHGLLMDCRGNVWIEAQSLFDEMKMMDAPTASAFYNALTDMLWHFGQKKGAQLVVLEGKRRNVWEGTFTDSCLDLHMMSSGAARAMVHAWLLNIRAVVFEGRQLPKLLSILTGWGKHSKVVGDGMLRRTIAALLTGMGAPFQVAEYNIGRFISTGSVVAAWLKESGTLKVLVLHDDRVHPKDAKLDQITNLGALPL